MIGKNLYITLAAVAMLSACIPDHWPEAWRVRTKPVYSKDQQPWCYRSLGKIDCYEQPMPGAAADHLVTTKLPVAQPSEPTILMSVVAPVGSKPVAAEPLAPHQGTTKRKSAHKSRGKSQHKSSKAMKLPKTIRSGVGPCVAPPAPPPVAAPAAAPPPPAAVQAAPSMEQPPAVAPLPPQLPPPSPLHK